MKQRGRRRKRKRSRRRKRSRKRRVKRISLRLQQFPGRRCCCCRCCNAATLWALFKVALPLVRRVSPPPSLPPLATTHPDAHLTPHHLNTPATQHTLFFYVLEVHKVCQFKGIPRYISQKKMELLMVLCVADLSSTIRPTLTHYLHASPLIFLYYSSTTKRGQQRE